MAKYHTITIGYDPDGMAVLIRAIYGNNTAAMMELPIGVHRGANLRMDELVKLFTNQGWKLIEKAPSDQQYGHAIGFVRHVEDDTSNGVGE